MYLETWMRENRKSPCGPRTGNQMESETFQQVPVRTGARDRMMVA